MNKNKIIGIICGVIVAVATIAGIVVAVINNNNNNSGGSSETRGNGTSSIVGKWKYFDEDLGSMDFIYTFNADGTGSYEMYGSKKDFTYKIDGKNISITYDTAPFETEYEINGDVLNVKDSAGNDTLYKKM